MTDGAADAVGRNGVSLSGGGQGSEWWVSNVKNDLFSRGLPMMWRDEKCRYMCIMNARDDLTDAVNSGRRKRIASAELDGAGAMWCEFRFRERVVSEQHRKNLSHSLPAVSRCKASLYAH